MKLHYLKQNVFLIIKTLESIARLIKELKGPFLNHISYVTWIKTSKIRYKSIVLGFLFMFYLFMNIQCIQQTK